MNPAVASGIMRVGASLKSAGAGFTKGATSFGRDTVNRTRYKIYKNEATISRKDKQLDKLDDETEEILRKEGREDLIEKRNGKKSSAGLIRKNLIDKPMGFISNLIKAWFIRNGPYIIDAIETFTKKVRVFLAVVKRIPGAVIGVVSASLNWANVFVQNILNFDFADRRKKMEAAEKRFDKEVTDANVTFQELSTVWSRDERELDLMLENLSSDTSIRESIDYAEKYASEDVDNTSPQPQNAMVGPGSQGAGMAGGAAPAATQISSGMGFADDEWDVFRNTIAKIESGGDYSAKGGSGGHYDGRYQMGADAKTDAAKYLGEKNPGHTPECSSQ
jgi:hypothetical protein